VKEPAPFDREIKSRTRIKAAVKHVGLIPVTPPLFYVNLPVFRDLARIVHGAMTATVVAGAVDPDHGPGSRVKDG